MQFLKKFSRHFFRTSAVIGLFTLFCTFFVPTFALAADLPPGVTLSTCNCYCASSTKGAIGPSVVSNYQTCATLCVGQHDGVVGCYPYNAADQGPKNDDKCWTEAECALYAADNSGNPTPGTWGGQSAYCVKTKSGEATGYCYAPDRGVDLNVAILGHTTVVGFHEYLALAYKFLLPAMSLVAVVMMMVGGLEYVVSGGSSKRVASAKKRITNALIGLILLMSAYTISALLDPRLVNLKALRTPLIKRAVLLDPGTTCEALAGYGFVITPDPKQGICGQQGVIQSTDSTDPKVKNSNFKVGDSCDFSRCATIGTSCVATQDWNSCLACRDIAALQAIGPAVTASDYVCGRIASQAESLDPKNLDTDPNNDKKYMCYFSHYLTEPNQCIEISSPTEYGINCEVLSNAAGSSFNLFGDPCNQYENLIVAPAGIVDVKHPLSLSNAYTEVQDVCEKDPCGLAAKGGYKGCKFTAGSINPTDPFALLTGGVANSCDAVE